MPRKTRESFGAIRKRSSGRYQASYVGLDGVRYNGPQTFDTLTDARGWLSIQRAALVSGSWNASGAALAGDARRVRADTLGEYSEEWLATRVNRHGEHLRPRTRVEYERLLKGSLSPLTPLRLATITPANIRTWYATQLATGNLTQASRAYGLLNSIMSTAVDDRRITSNPCMIRGAQAASTGKIVEPPTAAELQTILDTITPRYKAAVLIAAWAGCRYGELTELRRKDIRVLGADTIVVDVKRAVTHTTGIGYTIGKTKSAAGVRSIVLPPHISPEILEHLITYVADDDEALVFPRTGTNEHLPQSSFIKHWYPARKAAGRPDMPFHALRHFGATKYAATGATLKELQSRLGHSTVAAAMRYQHTAGRDEDLARRMSELAQT